MSTLYTQMCDGEMSVCTVDSGTIIMSVDGYSGNLFASHSVHLNAAQAREIAAALTKHADALQPSVEEIAE